MSSGFIRQIISLIIGILIVGGGIYFVKSQLNEEKIQKETDKKAKEVKKNVDSKVDNFRNKLNDNLQKRENDK